jgi:tetratricopeptide (TPR) repeat protein
MDTNADFHKANHGDLDPYYQSYFAVKELVLEHGMDVIPKLLRSTKNQNFYTAFQEITGVKIEQFQTTFLNRKKRIKELFNQADEAGKKKQYKNAENLYLEITRLDPYSLLADHSLPYLYIKQREFEKARNQLKAIDELDMDDLQMLSELSLLTNPQESLKYAEKEEEKIKINTGDDRYTSDFANAVRVTIKDPVTGYIMLFDKNLISYKEIQTELYKKLKQLYPNNPRIQGLHNK